MQQGPEDSKAWKDNNTSDEAYRENRQCNECGKVINLYHCADTGCPWCALCGTKVNPPKKEKS